MHGAVADLTLPLNELLGALTKAGGPRLRGCDPRGALALMAPMLAHRRQPSDLVVNASLVVVFG